MALVCIALGSNLGDRRAILDGAIRLLRAEPGFRILDVSRIYETDPVGGPDNQGPYLNAALTLETARLPREVLHVLHSIERRFGRTREVLFGPRTLDLDLLFHDQCILNEPDLVVPHPRLHERAFVLVPLAEIAPELHHPVSNTTVQELLTALPDRSGVKPFEDPSSTHELHLKGLTAFVTGSTSGIGRAIALAFTARGAIVTTHGRRHRAGRHLIADLSDETETEQLANLAWGEGLDILVCNAGADTLTGEAARWNFERKLEQLFRVDLKSTMKLARTLGERMKKRGSGVILTVGWDQAETGMEGDSGQLFAAIKGAVMCFSRSLSKDLAPQVRVNCLAPGWIRTSWGEAASDAWQERVRTETPLGVWGLPEDVAQAAVWLASPTGQFITGQTIRINGGAVRK